MILCTAYNGFYQVVLPPMTKEARMTIRTWLWETPDLRDDWLNTSDYDRAGIRGVWFNFRSKHAATMFTIKWG